MHTEQVSVTETYLLGPADAFKLVAVFDSESTSTDAHHRWQLLEQLETLLRWNYHYGTTVTKKNYYSILSYGICLNRWCRIQQILIVVRLSLVQVVRNCNCRNCYCWFKIITSNYVLDTGQRDNFYDISRIIRNWCFTTKR